MGRSVCWRVLELAQQRREFNCLQRAYSGFPTPLGTEALYTRILVCLKDRFKACLSNPFGEIFHVHRAPRKKAYSISVYPQTGSNEARPKVKPPGQVFIGGHEFRREAAAVLGSSKLRKPELDWSLVK